jgi:hypothetical protein
MLDHEVFEDVGDPEQAVVIGDCHNLQEARPGTLWVVADQRAEGRPFAEVPADVWAERTRGVGPGFKF